MLGQQGVSQHQQEKKKTLRSAPDKWITKQKGAQRQQQGSDLKKQNPIAENLHDAGKKQRVARWISHVQRLVRHKQSPVAVALSQRHAKRDVSRVVPQRAQLVIHAHQHGRKKQGKHNNDQGIANNRREWREQWILCARPPRVYGFIRCFHSESFQKGNILAV